MPKLRFQIPKLRFQMPELPFQMPKVCFQMAELPYVHIIKIQISTYLCSVGVN
jgi:hypothetical protein